MPPVAKPSEIFEIGIMVVPLTVSIGLPMIVFESSIFLMLSKDVLSISSNLFSFAIIFNPFYFLQKFRYCQMNLSAFLAAWILPWLLLKQRRAFSALKI